MGTREVGVSGIEGQKSQIWLFTILALIKDTDAIILDMLEFILHSHSSAQAHFVRKKYHSVEISLSSELIFCNIYYFI